MKPLEKIVQTLIINGSLLEHNGLFYGKTGIAIFFFHYAQYTGNELFQDYAMYLIEDVQKQIPNTLSTRYDIGLSGIGVAFEYLLQNDFLEVENKNFFNDFDARLYSAIMYEPHSNFNLQDGLTGWGRYFIYRLNGNCYKEKKLHKAIIHIADEIAKKISNNTVSENEQPDVYRFLHDLTKLTRYAEKYKEIFNKCRELKKIIEPDIQKNFPYMNQLQRLYTCQNYFNIDLTEEIDHEWKKWKEKENDSIVDMGLLSGWTSNALLHLTLLDNCNVSWINLL